MGFKDNNELDKEIEELKRERDLLSLKDEIKKLKRKKNIGEEVKKKSKKFFKVFWSVLIYLSAAYGLLLIAISNGDISPLIGGSIMLIPIIVKYLIKKDEGEKQK